jgi:hypothetical protein
MAKKVWTKERIQEVANYVCAKIADEHKSLRAIFYFKKDDDFELPNLSTFVLWMNEHEDIAKQYARAMDVRQAILFDEVVDLSDDSKGEVQRNRLQVDARKWALSKMNPKKYGDKVDVTSNQKTISQVPPWMERNEESQS